MENQVKILFPDHTAAPGLARLNGTVLTLETEENTVSLPTSELTRCSLSQGVLCHLSTRDGQTYTVCFDNEEQAKGFQSEVASKLTGSKKGLSTGAVVGIIAAVVVVIALIVTLVILKVGSTEEPTEITTESTTESTEDTEAPTEDSSEASFTPGTSDDPTNVLYRSSYSIHEAAPGDEQMVLPVAFNTDGDVILTNSVLQMNYWMEFYQFMNNYGAYAMYFGLDYNSPLEGQASMAEGQSWEQFFLNSAMVNFSNYYAMYRAAQEEGYEMTTEMLEDINEVTDCVNGVDLESNTFYNEALEAGFANTDEYLQSQFGPGVTTQDYLDYLTIYYTAMGYYDSVVYENADAAITEDDVEKELAENADTYGSLEKVNNVSVRHILISPEGEKDSETNDYTQEQWDDALSRANAVLELVQADPSEENFIALAGEYTEDPGSVDNGGLYEDFAPGTMMEEFNDWSFDPSRQSGDIGMVKTSYGYHIMFFVEQTETRAWFDTVKADLVRERTEQTLTALTADYPITVNYANVYLFDLITANAAEAE